MKKFNKIFALTLIAALMLTLSACGKDKENQNSKPDDTSKPTVSTPSENNTTTESKPEENKQEESKPESKPEESKPDPKPVKKTPAELIVGKWKGVSDISTGLVDAGFDIEGPLEINVETEFTASGTLIEKADKNQMSSLMRTVLDKAIRDTLAENGMTVEQFEAEAQMTLEEYIETVVVAFQNSYTYTAEYKFAADVLLVKFDGDPSFIETNYKFVNDDILIIYTDGEESTYTRVK